MLMVIFGAGASYDSSPDFPPLSLPPAQQNFGNSPPQSLFREQWRPPLADNLFRDDAHVRGHIVQKYPKLAAILTRLREPRNDRSVEEELESLQLQATAYPERLRQLAAVKYYLRDLLFEASNRWRETTSDVTNYSILIDELLRLNKGDEPICLVTFNYDLLLDRALFAFDYKGRKPEDAFSAHPVLKLFKPHGSVDWVRFVYPPKAADPRLLPQHLIESGETVHPTDEFARVGSIIEADNMSLGRTTFPAIAIPVQRKTEETFEWPPSHRKHLQDLLPQVKKILIIGWQGKEAHFLNLLREKLPKGGVTQITHLQVVGKDPGEASNISERFTTAIDRNVAGSHPGPTEGGFSHFVKQGLVEFLFKR